MHCNPHFRQGMFLILSQKETKRNEFERKKKEDEAREHEANLEVHRDPHLFQRCAVLTLSQKEKKQRELERQKEKEDREHEKLEVRATLLLPMGCQPNQTAEGKEAKATRT